MADGTSNETEPLMLAEEVAAVLRLHVQTVYRKARKGELPIVRVGRNLRFPRRQIEALATAETQAA